MVVYSSKCSLTNPKVERQVSTTYDAVAYVASHHKFGLLGEFEANALLRILLPLLV